MKILNLPTGSYAFAHRNMKYDLDAWRTLASYRNARKNSFGPRGI